MKIKDFIKSLFEYLGNNLGVAVIVFAYIATFAVFIGGLLTTSLFDDKLNSLGNKTLFWAVILPMFFLVISFVSQIIIFKIEHKKEMESLIRENQKRVIETREFSNLFKIINDFSSNDLYTTTLFGFLLEKLKNDLGMIQERNYFAEGMYWTASNKFIFSQKEVFCTCILTPEVIEGDLQLKRYFDEQAKKIGLNELTVTRVLMIEKVSDLFKYENFINTQIDDGVKLFLIIKDEMEMDDNNWVPIYKDFALAGNRFIIEAVISNNDFKGYQIREIKDINEIPEYVKIINDKKQNLSVYLNSFKQEITKRNIAKKRND